MTTPELVTLVRTAADTGGPAYTVALSSLVDLTEREPDRLVEAMAYARWLLATPKIPRLSNGNVSARVVPLCVSKWFDKLFPGWKDGDREEVEDDALLAAVKSYALPEELRA